MPVHTFPCVPRLARGKRGQPLRCLMPGRGSSSHRTGRNELHRLHRNGQRHQSTILLVTVSIQGTLPLYVSQAMMWLALATACGLTPRKQGTAMAVLEVAYCLREDVKRALDLQGVTRSNTRIDRAIEHAARDLEDTMLRVFYPKDDTRLFDWPNYQYAAPWKLYLKDNELAVWPPTQILVGTQPLDIAHVFPGPWMNQPGPPWTWFELDRSSNLAFGGNSQTPQRSISVVGTYGFNYFIDKMAALSVAITDAAATSLQVSDSSRLGPGAILVIDAERLLVQDCSMSTTGLTLSSGASTPNVNDATIVVSGATLNIDEVIMVDAERMLILDALPAANNYLVKRGWDSTMPAAHTGGATIYAARTLTVSRGALGTTAATHTQGTPVNRVRIPSTIRDLSIGLAEQQVTEEPSAYAGQPPGPEGHRVSHSGMLPLHARIEKAKIRFRRNTRIAAI